MKKLKLNLDEIKVESFEITSNLSKKGTVLGEATAVPNTEENDCTNVGCGTGTGTNVPACSDIFCTQCSGCPTAYGYVSCYFTCVTCATDCGTCLSDCGTCGTNPCTGCYMA